VVALGVAMPLAIYATVTLCLVSGYSMAFYNKQVFLHQYRHGIYRYRVLGTELLLLIGRITQHFNIHIETRAVVQTQGSEHWNLFTAFFILNGLAFLAFALLLYLVTVRDQRWLPPYLVLVVVTALGGYVVTPYDDLGYLTVASAVVVALTNRRWSWPICFLLAVVGTATRESFVVAVAALLAAIAARRTQNPTDTGKARSQLAGRLWAPTVAVGAGWLATYVGLKLIITEPRVSTTLWNPIPWSENWSQSSLIAAVVVLLFLYTLTTILPPFDEGHLVERQWYRRASSLLWVFSLPYLVVSIADGIWFEGLRLLLPVVICHYLLRWAAEDVHHRLDEGPDHRSSVVGSVPLTSDHR
jgi:hypothetical protein